MVTSTVMKTVKDYSEITTINGIHYIFEEKFSRVSRMFWFAVSIGLIIIAVLLIDQAYHNWKNNPILTSVNTTAYPIRKIAFPTITICSLGTIESEIQDAILWQVTEYIKEKAGNKANLNMTAGETYRDLLNKNGLHKEFLRDKYPGLDNTTDIYTVISLLGDMKPDNLLFARAISADSKCYEFPKNTTDPCGSPEIAHDKDNNMCYRLAGMATVDQANNGQLCRYNDREMLFDVFDGGFMEGIAGIIANSTGPLASLANATFWTASVYNHETGKFDMREPPPSSISMLPPSLPFSKEEDICLGLRFNKTANKFQGMGIPCNQSKNVICSKVSYQDCSQFGSMYTAWNRMNYLLDPIGYKYVNRILKLSKQQYQQAFTKLYLAKAYESLFEILWYSQVPCFDTSIYSNKRSRSLLKRCTWKGQEIPCSAIFSTFPTDSGMCCTFNMKAADKIFYNGSYQRMIKRMQDIDKNNAKDEAKLPEWYISGKEPEPQVGIKKGLSVILDSHTDLLSAGSVGGDVQGFVAIIGSSNQYPLLNENHIQIRPGHINLVGLSAIDVQSSQKIKSVPINKRKCYFSDEYRLELHSQYSQANCFLECQMQYARNVTTNASINSTSTYCTPWFLPTCEKGNMTSNNTFNAANVKRICDPWEAEVFTEAMQDVTDDVCDRCLPDCQFTEYQSIVTALPYRQCDERNLGVSLLCNIKSNDNMDPPIFGQQVVEAYSNSLPNNTDIKTNLRTYSTSDFKGAIFLKLINKTYDAYEKDIASVSFYFKKSTVFQFSRDQRLTLTDFLGQLGGFLGLCNGFSICSAVEILFWFTYRMWANIVQQGQSKNKVGK